MASGRPDCLPCQGSVRGSRGKCWQTNVTYQIQCEPCKFEGKQTVYIGETGKSSFRRAKNHIDGWKRGEVGNVLHEHYQDVHGDKVPTGKEYSMEITGKYRSCLSRQTSEGVLIDMKLKQSQECKGALELLNSHSQFHQPKLIKPRPSNINYVN